MSKKSAALVIIERAVAAMTPQLRKVYEGLAKNLADYHKKDILTRYDWGTQLAKIRSTPRAEVYGEAPIPRMAEALGVQHQELYALADFATTWTREDVSAMIDAAAKNGGRLTYTHLRLLWNVADTKLREQLSDRCVNEVMTTQDLAETITKKLKKSPRAIAPRGADAGLRQLSRLAESLTSRKEDCDKLCDTLDEIGAEAANDNLLERFDEAKNSLVELDGFIDSLQRRLSVAEERLLRLLRSKDAAAKSKKTVEADDDEAPKPPKKSKLTLVTADPAEEVEVEVEEVEDDDDFDVDGIDGDFAEDDEEFEAEIEAEFGEDEPEEEEEESEEDKKAAEVIARAKRAAAFGLKK